MKLTCDQVKKVAKLANLPITSEEEERYSQQLSKILDYIEQLNKVDSEGVEPLYNVSAKNGKLRPDVVEKSMTQDEALQNAVNKRQGQFVTKGVFENE